MVSERNQSHVKWFHWYEMHRLGKSIGTDYVLTTREVGKWEGCLITTSFLGVIKKIPKLCVMVAQLGKYAKTTIVHFEREEWILRYITYISIKPLERERKEENEEWRNQGDTW